jgi:hypothetical protein
LHLMYAVNPSSIASTPTPCQRRQQPDVREGSNDVRRLPITNQIGQARKEKLKSIAGEIAHFYKRLRLLQQFPPTTPKCQQAGITLRLEAFDQVQGDAFDTTCHHTR